jgi:Domain of unknown function (DUF2341)/Secretion system C-terminal sorting domain
MKKIFTLFLSILVGFVAQAQLSLFSNSKLITASNTSTAIAVNYQLKLTINTQSLIAASQMLSNGDDLRFFKNCNDNTQYNYWIESGINTPTTTIWVKVDTIAANGNRNFYMAYGNTTVTAVSSIPLVFNSAGSSTDSVASGAAGGSGNSQRGFRFAPNTDILVTSFGKREPTGTPRIVTLFNNTSQAIIAQQTVTGLLGTYTYSNLPSPIWLTQGTQYVIQLYSAAADGYYFGNSSQIDSRLTYFDMLYCNSCTQNTFPTSVLTNYHYGYADFLFYYKNIVTPAPTYSISNSALTSLSITATSFTQCAGATNVLTASGASTYVWNTTATTASISVTPTISTTYTLVGSVASCSSTKIISIAVNALPTLTLNSGAICAGKSFTVNPTGATTYSYSSGSAVVTPTATSTYTVMGVDANGCVGMAATTVTVNPNPVVTANSGIICIGNSFTIIGSGASTYSYSSGTAIVSPTATSVYTVTGANTNGCVGNATSTVTVNACVGVQEIENANALSIYPNPITSELNIAVNAKSFDNISLQIVNALGEIILTKAITTANLQINTAKFAEGVYFINIIDNNKVVKTQKIIKN